MTKAACLLAILFTIRIEATTRCGVRFQAPKGWTVTRVADKALKDCRVGLRPPDWDLQRRKSEIWLPECPVSVTVSKRPTIEVAGHAGFERVGDRRAEVDLPQFRELADDDWLVASKGLSKATAIRGKTWRGAIGETNVRTRTRDGRHPGSSTEFRALFIEAGGSARTSYAWCDAPVGCEDVMAALVASFRYLR
jgi:hypothetical protein